MSEETHNQKALRLFEEAKIEDSQETPYEFEWQDNLPPRILDKDGNVVAVISTGTLKGAYSTKTIIATAKRLMRGNGSIKPIQEGELINTYAPKQMIEAMERLPEGSQLWGNCVDKYGNWYNYPIWVGKVPGNNNMVCIQLKPLEEEYEEPYGYGFQLKSPEEKIFVVAENIADAMDKVTEAYPDREWEMINHSSVKVIGL